MSTFEAALIALIDQRVNERLEALAPAQEWFTVAEAADYLRISLRTMRQLVQDERVPSSFIDRRRIIRRAWLDEYAAAREERAVSPTTQPRRRARVPYVMSPTEGAHDAS